MLVQIKKIIAISAALVALAPMAVAQTQNGPGVIVGGGDKCANVNSVSCINSTSRSTNTLGQNGELDGETSKNFVQEYRDGLNDSTEVDGIIRPTTYCTGPNGEIIPHRSVLRFFFFERSANCTADSELRECVAGVLSGSATFATCEPFRNCTGPGYTLNHGQSGTFSNGPRAASCVTAQRTCFDGTVGGNTALTYFGTCTPFAGCTHQGVSIPHGGTRNFFRVNVSTNCTAERTTVSCNDGVVSGANLNYNQTSCVAPVGCTHQGVSIPHNGTANFFRVAQSTNCAGERTTVSCNNGVVTGNNLNYALTSCSPPPPPPANCVHQGVSIAHGTSRPFFRVNVSTNCTGERTTITCNNGTVTGSNLSYNQTSCVAPVGCTHQGVAMAHNSTRQFFRVNVSTNCPGEATTVTCNNGTVTGANLGYAQTSCAAPVGCVHHGVTMGHATSRSFWRVNESPNCAAEQTTVSCNNGTVSGANLAYNQTSCAPPLVQTPNTLPTPEGNLNEEYSIPAPTNIPGLQAFGANLAVDGNYIFTVATARNTSTNVYTYYLLAYGFNGTGYEELGRLPVTDSFGTQLNSTARSNTGPSSYGITMDAINGTVVVAATNEHPSGGSERAGAVRIYNYNKTTNVFTLQRYVAGANFTGSLADYVGTDGNYVTMAQRAFKNTFDVLGAGSPWNTVASLQVLNAPPGGAEVKNGIIASSSATGGANTFRIWSASTRALLQSQNYPNNSNFALLNGRSINLATNDSAGNLTSRLSDDASYLAIGKPNQQVSGANNSGWARILRRSGNTYSPIADYTGVANNNLQAYFYKNDRFMLVKGLVNPTLEAYQIVGSTVTKIKDIAPAPESHFNFNIRDGNRGIFAYQVQGFSGITSQRIRVLR